MVIRLEIDQAVYDKFAAKLEQQGLLSSKSDIRSTLERLMTEYADDISTNGYVWKYKNKHIVLPHGTVLSVRFKGCSYLATIIGNDIVYQGRSVTPSGFLKAVGSKYINAWQRIYIRFPNVRDHVKAYDAIRRKKDDEEVITDRG